MIFSFTDILDILLVSVAVYTIFFWFKKTKAAFVLGGFLISGVLYLAAREFRLHLATALMQGFFAVVLVAIVIIFQEEIRRFFEQIAMWSLNPRLRRRRFSFAREQADLLARVAADLAGERTGALMVIRGGDPVRRHLYGGIELGGALSEPLLKSIFDKHSAGHDGAVVIEDGRVSQFACHLPLSRDSQQLKDGGTRHAAALGLAELTDALCLVVSEERGTMAVAHDGRIEICDAAGFRKKCHDFYAENYPDASRDNWRSFFRAHLKEKIAAFFVATVLWFMFVHESAVVYKSFRVPVETVGLAKTFAVQSVEPSDVRVIFSGPRRDYYFVDHKDIRLILKLFDLTELEKRGEGLYEAPINPSDLVFPAGLSVENVIPRGVEIRIDKVSGDRYTPANGLNSNFAGKPVTKIRGKDIK